MFPLIQTATAILGAGFLFVAGLVVTDNILLEEETASLEPEAEIVVEVEPSQSPEPATESEVATSTSVATSTQEVVVMDVEVATTTIPTAPETIVIPEEAPGEEVSVAEEVVLEIAPNFATTSESITVAPEMETEVVLPAAPEEVITIDDIRQEVVEVVEVEVSTERSNCFLDFGYENPLLCLRETRRGLR